MNNISTISNYSVSKTHFAFSNLEKVGKLNENEFFSSYHKECGYMTRLYWNFCGLLSSNQYTKQNVINYACLHQDSKIYKILLKIEGDMQDENGDTSLHLAIKSGNLNEVLSLIDAGVDLHLKNKEGQSAFDLAKTHESSKIREALYLAKARLSLKNHTDNKLLLDSAKAGEIEMVKALIDVGVNINMKDKLGYSALQLASKMGHLEIVKALLKAGANPNIQNTWQWDRWSNPRLYSPLHLAILHNRSSEIVQSLIDFGADINARSSDGATPLHIAFQNIERLENAQVLLNAGADMNVRDFNNYTPSMYAYDKIKTSQLDSMIKLSSIDLTMVCALSETKVSDKNAILADAKEEIVDFNNVFSNIIEYI